MDFIYNIHSPGHFTEGCKALKVRVSHTAVIKCGLVTDAYEKLEFALPGSARAIEMVLSGGECLSPLWSHGRWVQIRPLPPRIALPG